MVWGCAQQSRSSTQIDWRSGLNAARSSSANNSGFSHAAKCPPLVDFVPIDELVEGPLSPAARRCRSGTLMRKGRIAWSGVLECKSPGRRLIALAAADEAIICRRVGDTDVAGMNFSLREDWIKQLPLWAPISPGRSKRAR